MSERNIVAGNEAFESQEVAIACSDISKMKSLLSVEEAEYLLVLSGWLKERRKIKDEQEKIRLVSKLSSLLINDSYNGVELTNLLRQFCAEEGFELYPKLEEIDNAYESLSGEDIYKKFVFKDGKINDCRIRISSDAKRISTAVFYQNRFVDTGLIGF